MSSATPSPKWPRSSAGPRRRAASWPPQPAAASVPRRLPRPRPPGGLATTFLHPIEGGEQIARAWVEIANRALSNIKFVERMVNGQLGLVAQEDGVTVTVFAFEVADDRIRHIWVVRNPEKLRPWSTG